MEEGIGKIFDDFKAGRMSRRQAVTAVLALAVPGLANPEHSSAPFKAISTNHVALSVTDVVRSRDFYSGLLGMKVSRDGSSSAFLDLPHGFLALFRQEENPGLHHFCLSVEGYDPDRAEKLLSERGLTVRRPQGSGRVYFDDPDGIEVQLCAPEFRG